MGRICALRPNVSRQEAIEMLSPRGLGGAWRRLALGGLHSVADFYIPFRLFEVELCNAGTRQTSVLGLDAVNGSLDLISFDEAPGPSRIVVVDVRNFAASGLGAEQAQQMVVEKFRRAVFSRGFFRMRRLSMAARFLTELHLPYWVGFRERNGQAHISIVDGVRRRMEGGKVRAVLRNWLADKDIEATPNR